MPLLPAKQISELQTLAKNNLFFLARGVLGYSQATKEFHEPLCRWLEDPAKRKKLICLPRGFFKTTIATKCRAIQNSLQDPNTSQLICCQIITNASKILKDIEQQWDSNEALQALFPEQIPTGQGKWNESEALLQRPKGFSQQESTYEAAGIGTQLQSRHYDNIFADDLIVPRKDQTTGAWMQPTEEDIQKAIGWHQMTFGLMRDVSKTKYNQIMTRWCPGDLYDYLLGNETDQWDCYMRSALLPDGTAAFPEKYSLAVLEEIKQSQGPYKFATQYLCEPGDPDSLMFKGIYNIYDRSETPSKFRQIYCACDPAIGQKKSNHPTAIIVAGVTETGERYVLDYVEQRLLPSETIDEVLRLWKKWHFRKLLLETVAYQEALKYAFQDVFATRGRLFRIVEKKPGSMSKKEARIEGLHPAMYAGWWHIPADGFALQEQLDTYPFCSFDDLLDTLAYLNAEFPPHKGAAPDPSARAATVEKMVITYEELLKAAQTHQHKQRSNYDRQDSQRTAMYAS